MWITNTEVFGFKAAIRGMRNPMNSWEHSDSTFLLHPHSRRFKMDRKYLKICFVGTHGTGKTTMAKIIHDWLQNKKIPTTLILESSAMLTTELNAKPAHVLYENCIVGARAGLFSNHENFISDRSLLDPLAYQMEKLGFINTHIRDLATSLSKEHILIYLPPNIPLVNNCGTRPLDINYQKRVDKYILRILHTLNKDGYIICKVPESNLIKRVDYIQAFLTKVIN